MLFRNCLELICKQVLLPRPILAVGTQSTPWYSTSSLYPPPPKRNRTAWTLYIKDHYASFKKENPDCSRTEVFAKLSECWRKVDKSIADKYHQLALADKQNYDKELENYKASLSLDEKSEIEKDKKQKRTEKRKEKRQLHALGMPKRPANAYILFSQDYMKKNADRSHDAYFKETSKLTEAWAKLPEKEKSKWEELAASHAKEYKKKLAEWELEMTSKGHLEVVHTKGKDKGAKA